MSLTEKQTHIEAFWQQYSQCQTLQTQDQLTIACVKVEHEEPVGHIVIANGRIESYLKYQEVFYDLFQLGYSVYSWDHRGQGLSQRQCANAQKGFVADFAYYTTDMHQVINQWVKPKANEQYYLLCHSMGSAVGALYAQQYQDTFQRIAFCAPMFGIATALNITFASWLVNQVCRMNHWISDEPWYFPGQGNYLDVPFKINQLTHCKYRYQWFKRLYKQQPELRLGGVTANWLQAAINGMAQLASNAHQLRSPCLVLQAGKDVIVDNQKQDDVCEAIAKCSKLVLPSAKHEILMEHDSVRAMALSEIVNFFSTPQSTPC